jgi:hypothetical protein
MTTFRVNAHTDARTWFVVVDQTSYHYMSIYPRPRGRPDFGLSSIQRRSSACSQYPPCHGRGTQYLQQLHRRRAAVDQGNAHDVAAQVECESNS